MQAIWVVVTIVSLLFGTISFSALIAEEQEKERD